MVSAEAKAFIDAIRTANRENDDPFDLETERRNSNAAGGVTHEAPGVVTTQTELKGIRTLCLTPANQLENRQLLFMHGGAFALMSPESHERFAGHVASACRAQTFLPDYSLAPEYPFPTGMNETIAILTSFIEDGLAQGRQTILIGESSGGA
ncbi:MAG: alpha/beta hydrolase fold domain-containing protein, partial [Chloroflexota bacterium]